MTINLASLRWISAVAQEGRRRYEDAPPIPDRNLNHVQGGKIPKSEKAVNVEALEEKPVTGSSKEKFKPVKMSEESESYQRPSSLRRISEQIATKNKCESRRLTKDDKGRTIN